VDPIPENLVGPGIEPGTSGSVARNSDHYTTEAVFKTPFSIITKNKAQIKKIKN
jgi:hypothetical protein